MKESIKGKTLNKGEWAELYVLLKLLGEGKLYTADNRLQKKLDCYLYIMKVIRQEHENEVLEYVIDKDNSEVIVKLQNSSAVLASIPMEEFTENAHELFRGIKDLKGSSVPAPESVCDFANIIYVSKPKAPSIKFENNNYGGKNDIIMEVHDGETSIVSIMGFSIKSKFGKNPTLFNAGSSSQFLFKLSNCDDKITEEFNSITEHGGRGWNLCKQYLEDHNITLEFYKPQSSIYENNLFLIRESMSKLLAWCVKDRLITSSSDFEVKETVERMIKVNPFNVANPEIYYEKAIKDFLFAGFSGMTAGRPWDGKEQVNGGYIVVTDEGEAICFHSSDREAFRDYLYRNTYFEYVSTDKYNWSHIIKIDDEYYLPLNISIRFISKTR